MKTKILTKILSIVGILCVLFSTFAVFSFAQGWQNDGDSTILHNAHPYGADSITFYSDYDYNYSFPQNYLDGTTNSDNGSNFSYYTPTGTVNLSVLTGVSRTVSDPEPRIHNRITNNYALYPTGTVNKVSINWNDFVYLGHDTELFAEYFRDDLVVFHYNAYGTYEGKISVTYLDPFEQVPITISETFQFTTTSTERFGIAHIIRAYLNQELLKREVIVESLSFDFYPLTGNGSPSTNSRFVEIHTYTPVVTEDTDPQTLVYSYPEMIYPTDVEPRGLFDWLGSALTGLLGTPLFYLGEDLYVSIGLLLGVVVGISLLFAFMKLFSGG